LLPWTRDVVSMDGWIRVIDSYESPPYINQRNEVLPVAREEKSCYIIVYINVCVCVCVCKRRRRMMRNSLSTTTLDMNVVVKFPK